MNDENAPLRYRNPVDQRGFTMMMNIVLDDNTLSDQAKVTYLTLLDYARQDDACFPGQTALAQRRGHTTDRTIRNHLAELSAAGLITVEQRGLGLTNLYYIESVQDAYRGRAIGSFEADRKNFSGQDRKENAGQDRKIFSGPDRKKIADKQDTVLIRPNVNNIKDPLTFNVKKDQNQQKAGRLQKRELTAPVQEVIDITGDSGSVGRFVQLREICEDHGCQDAWDEAFLSTSKAKEEGRLKGKAGAYFNGTISRILAKRNVYVPIGTSEERTDLQAEIAASLAAGAT